MKKTFSSFETRKEIESTQKQSIKRTIRTLSEIKYCENAYIYTLRNVTIFTIHLASAVVAICTACFSSRNL
jgi:glucose uptake protein GlcU